MSKPHVIVLQHVACEGPGIIEDALSSRGLYTKVIRIHEGQVVPGRIRGASGLVIMGGQWVSMRRAVSRTFVPR